MDGGNLLFDLPPTRQTRRGTHHPPGPSRQRRHPIRDAIMAFLIEPRTVKQIAEHIERRTSTATGHLRAMHKRALIVRLRWGVWVRRDKCTNPPDQTSIRRGRPVQDALLYHLQEPKTLDELEQITGSPRRCLQSALTALVERAVITKEDGGKFIVIGAIGGD
jgi:CRP-like cAMP-binding protein